MTSHARRHHRSLIAGSMLALTAFTLSGCSLFSMSTEDAGAHYLSIVCPANIAGDAYTAAVDTGDLATIKTAAQAYSDANRLSTASLLDESTNWPGTVDREDLKTIANANLAEMATLSVIVQAETLADTRVFLPNSEGVGEAAQRVRLALDLPSDTSVGCE